MQRQQPGYSRLSLGLIRFECFDCEGSFLASNHCSKGRRSKHFTVSGSLMGFCDAVLTPESYEKLTQDVHKEVDEARKKKGLKPFDWKKLRKTK